MDLLRPPPRSIPQLHGVVIGHRRRAPGRPGPFVAPFAEDPSLVQLVALLARRVLGPVLLGLRAPVARLVACCCMRGTAEEVAVVRVGPSPRLALPVQLPLLPLQLHVVLQGLRRLVVEDLRRLLLEGAVLVRHLPAAARRLGAVVPLLIAGGGARAAALEQRGLRRAAEQLRPAVARVHHLLVQWLRPAARPLAVVGAHLLCRRRDGRPRAHVGKVVLPPRARGVALRVAHALVLVLAEQLRRRLILPLARWDEAAALLRRLRVE
mmetsp:Transcript_9733/g.28233  ORF Transcript_9733/g.28233 Transcript_9733/m.28233 type:complete len:266 (-) Transcript_9733:140-937(-)